MIRKAELINWVKNNKPIKILDWYIIKKFIGTYFFSILLIISIAIVFDINENLEKFAQYHPPLKAIVFDYYANFVPYYTNLFSPLFVFIAVDYLHVGSRCFIQATHASIYDIVCHNFIGYILSRSLCDTTRNCY